MCRALPLLRVDEERCRSSRDSKRSRRRPQEIVVDREQTLARHKKLTQEGWERRFTAEEPRLSEMKELYESMGLDVRIEAAVPEEGQECSGCFDLPGFEERYKTLYTRGHVSDDWDASDQVF